MSNYTRNMLTGDLAPVNAELEKIEDAIADQLDRKPAGGEANQLESQLDVNSQRVINLAEPVDANDAARKKDVQDAVAGFPDDTGDAGKFLQTDGAGLRSWETPVDAQTATNTANIASNTAAIAALSSYYSLDGTAKTTAFTAVLEKIHLVDTTSGTIDITLPTSPTEGDKFAWVDLASNFATNKATLKYNATDKIMGLAEDNDLDLNNFNSGIIYTGSDKGWMYL